MGRAFEYRRASKEARWGKMSRLFPKLGKSITMAAKDGGMDPSMNPKLRTAIATAKAQNMPKDNIDAAIKRAGEKDSLDIKTIHYDGKAKFGVQLIVECATDNPTRTVANVKSIFNKNGGEFLPTGSLSFMFSRKSVFEIEIPNKDLEELEFELIDFGLSEMKKISIDEDNEILQIYGDYENFGTLSEGIEKLGLNLKSGNLQFVANNFVDLDENNLNEVMPLIEKLEEDDDVLAVYTNISED